MPNGLRKPIAGRRALSAGLMGLLVWGSSAFAEADHVLATVNGRSITEADLQLEAVLRRVPPEQMDARRESLMNDLIDQTLIEVFLSRKRAKANPIQLDAQVERISALIRRRSEDPAKLFETLGLNEDQLRDRLSVSLAWRSYVERMTTDRQLRAYFQQHRRELDGTQLRARHIIIKVPEDDAAGRQSAQVRLEELRKQIEAGLMTFANAAAEHSDGPSREADGDVGYFAYRGTMSAEFAAAAFALSVGQVSRPVETPFGVHLIQVTDERPGQLSLEDVRPQILERISQQQWDEQIKQERARAKIVLP